MFPISSQPTPAEPAALRGPGLPGRGHEGEHRSSVLRELRLSARWMLAVLTVMLVSVLVTSGYVLGVNQRQLTDYTDVSLALQANHEAMLDQETGLRAWLATGDRRFLEPFTTGRRASTDAQRSLQRLYDVDDTLTVQLLDLSAAQQAWVQDWAEPAAEQRDETAALTPLLLQGKEYFDAYRGAYARALDTTAGRHDRATQDLSRAVRGLIVSQVGLSLLAVAVLVHRSRRLDRLVVHPVQLIDGMVERIHRGQKLDPMPDLQVRELDDVTKALVELSTGLAVERAATRAEQQQAQRSAARLADVLAAGQAMAASSTETALVTLLVRAAAQLADQRTSLWAPAGHGPRSATGGTWTGGRSAGDGVESGAPAAGGPYTCRQSSDPLRPPTPRAAELVVRVARDGRSRTSQGDTAIPLIGSGQVLAVLHVEGADRGDDSEVDTALEALVVNATAHLEAVRVLERTHLQASTDALTGLGNRHRMREELEREWARASRHDRPLSLGLLDLDHFKRVNDTAGHPVGDAWLRLVADTVTAQLRSHDLAYRYGGEEIAVLLPETDEDAAAVLFERVRAAVEAVEGPVAAPSITCSIGIGQRGPHIRSVDHLVAVADEALYEAKRAGRNLVVRSSALARPTASPS